MAGHNKWSKVKHTKGPADAKRGRIFSKLSKEITLAARSGGNPDMNARLRSAILAAKAQNMPNDTIERALKKGTGELGGAAMEEIVYEGYAPGGVAMLVEVATDNRNRSSQDMRTLFSKNNGTFADAGSVAYLFQRRGEIRLDKGSLTEDQATELALECGADDVVAEDEDWVLYTAMDQLFPVAAALKERQATAKSQQLIYLPSTTITIDDPTIAAQLVKLYDILDDYDDTQNVFANFEVSDALIAKMGG
jgi:YebC/PmpR family DNA-binding regulatory protein